MKKNALLVLVAVSASIFSSPVLAVETAPRISDREIVEKLSTLEQGQKNLDKRFDDLRAEMIGKFDDTNRRIDDTNQRIDGLRAEMIGKFDDINRRIDDTNQRIDDLRADINKRFEILTWMIGIFIAIAMAMFGFIFRILWLMQKRQTAMETTLETHKDEIAFLKSLIEKLLPPKGVL